VKALDQLACLVEGDLPTEAGTKQMERALPLSQVIRRGLKQEERTARCIAQPQPGGAGVFSLTCADYTPILKTSDCGEPTAENQQRRTGNASGTERKHRVHVLS
jgi:hypothetical protein